MEQKAAPAKSVSIRRKTDQRLRYAKNRSNEAREFSQHGRGFDPNSLDRAMDSYYMGGMGELAAKKAAASEAFQNTPSYKVVEKKLPGGVSREVVEDNQEAIDAVMDAEYAKARQQAAQQWHDRHTKDPFPKKKEEVEAPDDDKVKRPKY